MQSNQIEFGRTVLTIDPKTFLGFVTISVLETLVLTEKNDHSHSKSFTCKANSSKDVFG